MNITPLTLTGRIVRLDSLAETHIPDLVEAGNDPAIWRYMPCGLIDSRDKMTSLVCTALEAQARGTDLPFAVILQATGKAVGMTRYMDIRPKDRGLEIGWTWYATDCQRTGVNTECKYLLLKHAFEVLGCLRVQLKTDLRNESSQRAIQRIGGVREGVLRNNMILADGYLRSTVYFSILAEEWPAAKARLEALILRN